MNNTVMNKSSNVEDTDNKEIEVIRDSLKKRPDGSPRQTIENVIEVLNKDPMLKDAIRRNELSCKTDIVKKMDWRRRSKTFTDTDFNNIMLRMEKFYGITRDKNIKRAIDIVGNNNHYHPIIDKLESLEWDGKSRLRYLLPRYLGTDESDYIFEATRIMMMGAVHRVYHPGCKFEYMVCLVGGQGAGKSSFLRLLAMENEWFSDDLRKLDDDNVFRKIQGHWIIEMADEEFVCVQMIYERALHHENCKPKQYESREITSIMRLKFAEQWEEVKSHRFIKEGYGTQLAWKRKM